MMGISWVSIFCMDVALTSDHGCSAFRQNEIASTGLMTFHGQHSLFLKVTGCVFMTACVQLTGKAFLYKDRVL